MNGTTDFEYLMNEGPSRKKDRKAKRRQKKGEGISHEGREIYIGYHYTIIFSCFCVVGMNLPDQFFGCCTITTTSILRLNKDNSHRIYIYVYRMVYERYHKFY